MFLFRKNDPEEKKLVKSLQNIFGYTPDNLFLYKQALRHRSIAKEVKSGVKDSNERLEFLGDAVLSIVVADYLFLRFPYKDEGFLTEMRSKLVNRNQLNKLAVKLGLSELMELNTDGFSSQSAVYGNALEAIIGALYLDKGYVFAKKVLVHLLNQHFDIDEIESMELNFKSKLIEWAQKERKNLAFKVLETIGHRHNIKHVVGVFINDEIVGKAQGPSVKIAEKNASEEVYRKLIEPTVEV